MVRKFYHGTSTYRLNSIKKYGLLVKPKDDLIVHSLLKKGYHRENVKGVFVTPCLHDAVVYAYHAEMNDKQTRFPEKNIGNFIDNEYATQPKGSGLEQYAINTVLAERMGHPNPKNLYYDASYADKPELKFPSKPYGMVILEVSIPEDEKLLKDPTMNSNKSRIVNRNIPPKDIRVLTKDEVRRKLKLKRRHIRPESYPFPNLQFHDYFYQIGEE